MFQIRHWDQDYDAKVNPEREDVSGQTGGRKLLKTDQRTDGQTFPDRRTDGPTDALN